MKFLERYCSPSDLPPRLPVFPLLGAIILPRTTLPLNVFEPRYLAMIDDALRGDRIIGMIQPVGDGGVTGSPTDRRAPLRAIGCAARIIAFQEQEDGRFLITLFGICRFEVVGDVENKASYRTLDVAYDRFDGDFQPDATADAVPRTQLLAVLRRFLDARQLEPDWAAIERSQTEDLVNGIAIASPFAPTEKQALLEAPTLVDRAETLITLAEIDAAGGATGKSSTRLQ